MMAVFLLVSMVSNFEIISFRLTFSFIIVFRASFKRDLKNNKNMIYAVKTVKIAMLDKDKYNSMTQAPDLT